MECNLVINVGKNNKLEIDDHFFDTTESINLLNS